MLSGVSRALDSGCRRIVVEAVPGAGKSHTLVELARGHRTLILAYNSMLAKETSARLDALGDTTTVCLTFHALCGRHLGVARDDFQLEDLVADVERGGAPAMGTPSFDRILIDEAQDVRSLYVRLLRVLDLLHEQQTIVLVGDRLQLVYDFDEDFPASLDVLVTPPTSVLAGAWTRLVTNETRRLTRPMCGLVNAMFGTRIYSEIDGPKVEVRCPRSAFAMHAVLDDLRAPYLLLVDRRRNNAPLRALLNHLSREGVAVNVCGIDDVEEDTVCCATYWSAKGVQAPTVVVLLPGSASRNPTYVALTRSCRRLVVVLDPKDPHAALCDCVARHPSHFSIVGVHAQRALQMGRHQAAPLSLQPRTIPRGRVVCLDACVPRASAVRRVCTSDGTSPQGGDEAQDDSAHSLVVCLMARIWVECRTSMRCRAMESLLNPTRMHHSTRDVAIENGFVGRSIPLYQQDVLSPDLLPVAREAYRRLQEEATREGSSPTAVWMSLYQAAAAMLAWDTFEYVMRRTVVPSSEFYADRLHWVSDVLSPETTFDTRLTHRSENDQRTFHVRVHGTCDECAYHLVWTLSSSDVGLASVRALLHPRFTCRLLLLSTKAVVTVTVEDREVLWDAIAGSERG